MRMALIDRQIATHEMKKNTEHGGEQTGNKKTRTEMTRSEK